jgi:hypothetical protein
MGFRPVMRCVTDPIYASVVAGAECDSARRRKRTVV